jgi:hypothetical protein
VIIVCRRKADHPPKRPPRCIASICDLCDAALWLDAELAIRFPTADARCTACGPAGSLTHRQHTAVETIHDDRPTKTPTHIAVGS